MNPGGLHAIIELEENDDIQPSGAHVDAPEQQPLHDADDDKKTDPSGACSSTNSSLEREIEAVKQRFKILLDGLTDELKTALGKDEDIIASLAALRERALAVEDSHRKKVECIEKTLGEIMSTIAAGRQN